MEINKPVTTVMAILVTVLIVATVAIPMLAGFNDDVRLNATNDNIRYYADEGIPDKDLIVSYDSGVLTVGDYVLDDKTSFKYIMLDNGSVVITAKSMNLWIEGKSTLIANESTAGTITFKNDGSWVIDSTLTTEPEKITGSYSKLIYPSVYGTYGLFSKPVYVNENFKIYVPVDTSKESGYLVVDNGVVDKSQSAVYTKNGIAVEYAPTVDITDAKPTADLKFSGVSIIAGDGTISANWFFAPAEYKTGEGISASHQALLSIIPVLMLLVPIFIAISAFRGRTD